MHILINSESSTGCLEDVLILRAGRDMGWSYFSSLTQLHTTNDLGSALIQRPLKWQQIFEICFSLASFVFLLGGFASQCYWGREKKRSWKETAFFGSHNMNTAQHCPNTCSLHPSMDSWVLLASHQHRLHGLRYGIHHATVPQFNSFLWPLHLILTLWKNSDWYCCELWNSFIVN